MEKQLARIDHLYNFVSERVTGVLPKVTGLDNVANQH